MNGASQRWWALDTWWGPLVVASGAVVGGWMANWIVRDLLARAGIFGDSEIASDLIELISYLAFAMVPLVVAFLVCSADPVSLLGLRKPTASSPEIAAASIAAIGLTMLGDHVVHWMLWMSNEPRHDTFEHDVTQTASTLSVWLLSIVLTSVAAGVAEEVLDRGFLMRAWLRRWHPGVAVAASTLFFCVTHLSPQHAMSLIPVGIWFGYVAWRTGSTITTIIAHVFTLLVMQAFNRFYEHTLLFQAYSLIASLGGLFAAVWLVRRWGGMIPGTGQAATMLAPPGPASGQPPDAT